MGQINKNKNNKTTSGMEKENGQTENHVLVSLLVFVFGILSPFAFDSGQFLVTVPALLVVLGLGAAAWALTRALPVGSPLDHVGASMLQGKCLSGY